jgi:hypothetical protein
MLTFKTIEPKIVNTSTMTPLLDIKDVPIEEGESYVRVLTATFISSDLVVSPVSRDEAGNKCLVITDLNFGEMTNGVLH